MSAHPWLVGPSPDVDCPREMLEERIRNLLATHNTAVIATVDPQGAPAATPVRYSVLGFEIMYTSWNDSPKSRNLRRDPRVSAGIVAPLVGPAGSRGAQLMVITPTRIVYTEHWLRRSGYRPRQVWTPAP